MSPNIIERDSYDSLSNWLFNNYSVKNDDLWLDAQIHFGSIKTRCDVIGYQLRKLEEQPACQQIDGIHLVECKFDYSLTQAYGQILFYREIVHRYLNSKHREAFNCDYYDGIRKYHQKNGRFPPRYKSSFYLPNKFDLYMHLALIDTGHLDDTLQKFLKSSAENFLDGKIGLLVLKYQGRKKFKVATKKEAKSLPIEIKMGPKPEYQIEPQVADIFRKTRLDCRRYREGSKNFWCSEDTVNSKDCEACKYHIRI
jgi:hypothetical protein